MKMVQQGNNYRQEFEQIFDSLCYRHPKFKVWTDFIHMTAYAISNSVNYRQDREDAYLSIVRGYTKDELAKLTELFPITVLALEDDRYQDFLGELYMSYRFGDTKKGEYFTPYSAAYMMSKMTGYEKDEREYATVCDPCCGSGVMLIAYVNLLIELKVNYHTELLVVATDINPCIALMCYIQLSLLGCAGYVCIRNSLTEPITGENLFPPEEAFIMPLFLHPVWMLRRSKKIVFGESRE